MNPVIGSASTLSPARPAPLVETPTTHSEGRARVSSSGDSDDSGGESNLALMVEVVVVLVVVLSLILDGHSIVCLVMTCLLHHHITTSSTVTSSSSPHHCRSLPTGLSLSARHVSPPAGVQRSGPRDELLRLRTAAA